MARVLCVNPWIVDFAAYNSWIEPLGLLAVAAALRQAGHDVALIDCLDRRHPDAPAPRSDRDAHGCGHFAKVELAKPPVLAHVPRRWGRYGLPLVVFDAELEAQPRPDAVLVTSMMSYWYPGPFEAIRRVKARWADVPVALGGIYATLCPDHARAWSGADAVFTGPGESQALRWVESVADDKASRRFVTGSPSPDEVWPAHDLRRPQGYVAIRTARGCPFDCPYCAVHQLAPRGFWPRPAEQVVGEIAWCVESLGAQDVAFYDDALLVQAAQHIHPILDTIIERGLPVRFHTPNGLHARFIDLPLAQKMRRAGFVTVRLGLETADPATQLRDGAKVDDPGFARAVEALFAAGFAATQMAAYVLIGRPGQCVAETQATVAFVHRLGIPVSAAQFSPIPGTAEWQAAIAAGYIPADADPLLHNNSAYPCAHAPADAQAWEEVKQQIREGNRALLSASAA
jgi:radical SAM superfamily enzyme YgiQ (UPF0313 family)